MNQHLCEHKRTFESHVHLFQNFLLFLDVLHIYDAMPQTSCPPSNMTEKIGRHEDCDHGSGREDDGVELLVQPLLHPKGSIVTAISYYGTDGAYVLLKKLILSQLLTIFILFI